MSVTIRPMKPVKVASLDELKGLKFPCVASRKIDGVRCMMYGAIARPTAMSSRGKPHASAYVQRQFSRYWMYGFDGELSRGDPTDPVSFRETVSCVRTNGSMDYVKYLVFDWFGNPEMPFMQRLVKLGHAYTQLKNSGQSAGVELIEQMLVHSLEEVEALEEQFVSEGYEGIILRDPNAPYKQGRSTLREGGMIALKRSALLTGKIVQVNQLMKNDNPIVLDEFGLAKRSTSKANQIPQEQMGSLTIEWDDKTFNVGTGFTEEDRILFWAIRDRLIGQTAKVKYFGFGGYDNPRCPRWNGLTDERSVLE